jgi:hypothetical protein
MDMAINDGSHEKQADLFSGEECVLGFVCPAKSRLEPQEIEQKLEPKIEHSPPGVAHLLGTDRFQ